MGLQNDRERRLKATGKWFQKTKDIDYLWTNHLYPIALIISLIFVFINLQEYIMYYVKFEKNKYYIKDPNNNNKDIAYSRNKRKASNFSKDLLIQGFEGHIPGFMFDSPINLDYISKKE